MDVHLVHLVAQGIGDCTSTSTRVAGGPALRMVMPVRRRLRQVTVRFAVEEVFIPGL